MTKLKKTGFGIIGLLVLLSVSLFLLLKNNGKGGSDIYYPLTGHITYQDDAMLWEGGKPSNYYTVWLHINRKNQTVQNVWDINSIDSNGEYTILLGCVDKGGKTLYAQRTFSTGTYSKLDTSDGHILEGYNIITIETGIKTTIPNDLSGKTIGLSITRPITAYPLIQDMPDSGRGMCEAYAKVKDITILGEYVETPIDTEVFTKQLPVCKVETLKDYPIETMDTLVKDCNTTPSKGILIDGLGGLYPEYEIAEGQLLTPSYDDVSLLDSICKIGEGSYIPRETSVRKNELTGYNAVQKIIGKGLLSSIAPRENPDYIYCSTDDKNCKAMIDYEGWTDGSNYFVAGYRDPWSENRKLYYTINGKLYYPGKNIEGRGFLKQSKWNFVGIKDKKAIVRRIVNGKLPVGVTIDEALQHIDTIKTDISVETCSIDL